ncbi:MAG TPA: biopolymer transporter ExbD, partial [Polyangia bacterium]|nr:biopolymer transporter ExbD [Polyangia bacterium]
MAGTMASGRGRARTIAQINVTPLVDVVLVLLVILMVASTYIVAQTLKVQLPRAKSTDGTAEKPTKVELLKDGKLRWNEQPVAESELAGKMKAAVDADAEMSLV